MIKVVEITGSLAPEQYGSRKRHKAIDLAVNKAITFDILRQLERSGAICSNDAKLCYDLIGHTPASLSMQRVGAQFFKFVGYAFVDDTDVIQSVLSETPAQAIAKLQEAIDTWEFSLKDTCGALAPEKKVWWLVSFVWNGSSWQYASIQDSPGELQVNDISDSRKTIKRLAAHEAYETLGVFLAPNGNSQAQFEKMRKAVASWVDGLRTGIISKDEVWLALQSTILRTLYYPLPALRLTKAQCKAIMSPPLQYCLPALGICRNFPRLLVFLSS